MQKSENILIGQRNFTLADQLDFAKFSGDANPIHIDTKYARKTIAGQCIVHGINGLMWAMDSFIAETGLVPSSIKVKFIKPIYLNENITCYWNSDNKQLTILSGDISLTMMTLAFGEMPAVVEGRIIARHPLAAPRFINKKSWLKFGKEALHFRGDKELARATYPKLSVVYGVEVAAEIAMISEVVGMHMPGLNSLILSANINLDMRSIESVFTIKKVDDRFDLITLQIHSPNIASEVKCFLTPEATITPSFEKLNESIDPKEFDSIRALIIGGSRGLGEATARSIAAGGGKVSLTYSNGYSEAKIIQNDCLRGGRTCSVFKVTVPQDIDTLKNLDKFNQIYYFPTPKIFGKRSNNFQNEKYGEFYKIYVNGFSDLIRQLNTYKFKGPVYYPSTIAIENPTPDLAEYIEAKKEGEFLCKELNGINGINIIVTRLPRSDTDQTKSLIKVSAKDPNSIMVDIIRKMISYN